MATELNDKYEELVWVTGPSEVALVAAHAVAYGMEWSGAVVATKLADRDYCSDAMLRVLLENTANLLYILYAGPQAEGRSQNDLAAQYLAFGDYYHVKLINKTGAAIRKRIRKTGLCAGKQCTVEQFDEIQEKARVRVEIATKQFADHLVRDRNGEPTFSSRWTKLSMEDMIDRVIKDLPPWFDNEELLTLMHGSVTNWNSALHASAFNFPRDRDRITKEAILKFPNTQNTHAGHMAGYFAFYNWLALAELVGDLKEVKKLTNAKWEDRFTPIVQKHFTPQMVRVDKL